MRLTLDQRLKHQRKVVSKLNRRHGKQYKSSITSYMMMLLLTLEVMALVILTLCL